MSAENPPLYLQNGTHPAVNDRRFADQLFGGKSGVVGFSDLVVTEKSGTANMSVDISGGSVIVQGTEISGQGAYFCYSSASVNVAVTPADATNARYDLVVARVQDSQYSGASNEWGLEVVAGTASATPEYPSVPANSVVLAVVTVPASASSIVDANIADVRYATATDGTTTLGNTGFVTSHGGVRLVSSRSNVSSPSVGDVVREISSHRLWYYDGTNWRPQSGATARVYNSAAISLTHNTSTELTFDSETYDLDGFHSTVSNTGRLTVPTGFDGTYHVSATAEFAANTTGGRQLAIKANGSLFIAVQQFEASSVFGTIANVSTTVNLSAGEYVTVEAFQTSGGSLNVSRSASYSPEFSITKLD